MRVLILGGRAPVALDLARRFARSGHTVLIGDSASSRLSGASRAVAITLPRLPAPRTQLADYASALRRHIARERIDLVIPTCEETFYLSHIRSQLPAQCAVFAAPIGQLQQLHSKLAALRAAATAGIRVPASAEISTIDEARDWARGRAVVLKPEYSRFGVHVRSYDAGIPHDTLPLPTLGRWVAQELCAGTELCSYAVAVHGRLCLNITYQPVYRLARSSGYYFEAREVPEIDAGIARLVALLGYHGQISFDWFVDAQGRATMIECNPRAVSGLHLLPEEDDPVGAAILDGRSAQFDAVAPRPRMLAAVMLGAGLPRAVASGHLRRWWHDWRRASDVLMLPGDRAPAGGALRDLCASVGLAWHGHCSLREVATQDIEWDGKPLPE
ncbi:MAG TPA: hypothetical protein VMK82_00425 [Steroidobacteraceae bacterium]|nr:hypothetical protein [Steroidobacteraceae bacterium]